MDLNVVVSEFQHFPSNASTDLLRVSPILQVVVIRSDNDFMGGSHEKGPGVSQPPHHCQEFSVEDVVVSLCFVEHFG